MHHHADGTSKRVAVSFHFERCFQNKNKPKKKREQVKRLNLTKVCTFCRRLKFGWGVRYYKDERFNCENTKKNHLRSANLGDNTAEVIF